MVGENSRKLVMFLGCFASPHRPGRTFFAYRVPWRNRGSAVRHIRADVITFGCNQATAVHTNKRKRIPTDNAVVVCFRPICSGRQVEICPCALVAKVGVTPEEGKHWVFSLFFLYIPRRFSTFACFGRKTHQFPLVCTHGDFALQR